MKQDVQESFYDKAAAEISHPDPCSGGLRDAPSPAGFAEGMGICGWGEGAIFGWSPTANNHTLQQNAMDNTALGRISIPA